MLNIFRDRYKLKRNNSNWTYIPNNSDNFNLNSFMYRVMFLKCYTGSHWKRWMSSKQLISAANSCHIFLHQQYSCSIYIFNVFSWVHSWSWNVMFSARRREVHFLEKVSSMKFSTNCKYCLSQIPISVIVWKKAISSVRTV